MAYKIAIASTDGVEINAHFGSTETFLIVRVEDDGSFQQLGRTAPATVLPHQVAEHPALGQDTSACSSGSSCKSQGGGCGGGHDETEINEKIVQILDCRCLLCKKVGAGVKKQLEKKSIAVFEVDYKIEAALKKIIDYYRKIDQHISLRKA
ncbi:Dinitrogenase iron-molybdenum cofactor [Propionispira arboris]|uniref:Dinitrogenase iron-molybdenum cofactor n=1 Tax=Propionispira arboris TaxID=84035 RepID=A0A1H7AP54_9FIRM|nr:NifB/NifX family molybdenum-iron cluster-binding protein [Propionispira arboris]SEJ67118.1 Dinitrogenase iron-molybdenum cofactor [Propionispira arboris]